MTQLRIAETEKYAHVTFFFNGGEERLFPGEERILVPSPKVATYDLKPEMSAYEVTDKLVAAIESGQFDLPRHTQDAKGLQDTREYVSGYETKHPEHDHGTDELAPGRDPRPGRLMAKKGVR